VALGKMVREGKENLEKKIVSIFLF
jgi:hypothetical protein